MEGSSLAEVLRAWHGLGPWGISRAGHARPCPQANFSADAAPRCVAHDSGTNELCHTICPALPRVSPNRYEHRWAARIRLLCVSAPPAGGQSSANDLPTAAGSELLCGVLRHGRPSMSGKPPASSVTVG